MLDPSALIAAVVLIAVVLLGAIIKLRREGYTFADWYADSASESADGAEDEIDDDEEALVFQGDWHFRSASFSLPAGLVTLAYWFPPDVPVKVEAFWSAGSADVLVHAMGEGVTRFSAPGGGCVLVVEPAEDAAWEIELRAPGLNR